jgi:hypothetical protein
MYNLQKLIGKYSPLPNAAMQTWIDTLTTINIGPDEETTAAIADRYARAYSLVYKKLQDTYKNATTDMIVPVAITLAIKDLQTSAPVLSHKDKFALIWEQSQPSFLEQKKKLERTVVHYTTGE